MDVNVGDPIVSKLGDAIAGLYGDQLDHMLLYGSRARGDARHDSDYDIAVFLKALPDRWAEIMRLADLEYKLLDENGVFLDAKPFVISEIDDPSSPLMFEIRRDGVRM